MAGRRLESRAANNELRGQCLNRNVPEIDTLILFG